MKKNILEEIYRTQKLMGVQTRKPLITEQLTPFLMTAIKSGGKNMDDLIELVIKGVTKGGPIGSKEIDELIEYVKSTEKYADAEIEILRKFLNKPAVSSHIQSGKGLFTDIGDLTDDITEMEAELLSRLAKLSDGEIEKIISSLIKKAVNNITDLPLYLKIESFFTNELDDILNNSTKFVNSVEDDLYKRIDDYLDDKFKISDDASDVAKETKEKWLNEFKTKVKESPKLTAKIKELQDAGKIGPRQTPAVVDDVVDDISRLNLDEWGPMIDNSGKLGTKWGDNFFFRYCKLGFCEAIIDFTRSLGRSPENFVKDTVDTLNKIDELFKNFSPMNAGDSGYVALKKELDGYVNRLKSNAKMLQTKDLGFETTWNSIEANIRKTLTKDGGDATYANDFIDYIKNKSVTSGGLLKGGETIQQFIDLMKVYYVKKSGSIELINAFEMLTPEFWKNWRNTPPIKYAEEVKAVFKEDPKYLNNIVGRIYNSIGKVLWDITLGGIKRALNFLTIGTFRYYSSILKRLKTGKFTNWKGLENYGTLYIELVLITNVLEPIKDFLGNSWDSWREIEMIGEDTGSEQSPWDQLKSDFKSKLNVLGSEFDWVPFYNPIPRTDGTHLGLKPAPLPNYLIDRLVELFGSLATILTTDTTGNVIENRKTKILEQINPQIADLNKELQDEWDSATPKEKETIKEKNGYYKDYYDILKFTYDDEIDPTYLKMILDTLEYNPRISSDTVMKMVDLKSGDFSKLTEYTKLLKDSKTAIADVKGFMTIKDKGGKKYRIILKPSNDELYYIEPSIDVIDKDPRTKIQQKNIKDFVNKLK